MYPTAWQTYDPRGPGVYGEEAKCWEHAVFDLRTDQQVGVGRVGHPGYTGREDPFRAYGLSVRVRQTKEFKPRVKRAPERKETVMVRIETYDRDGNLTDLSVEGRMVYFNSKGAYIKTRSNGSPRITERRGDVYVIIYRPQEVKTYGGGTRWTLKPVEPKDIIDAD